MSLTHGPSQAGHSLRGNSCVLLTLFQLYQEDVRMIMKGCMQWNLVHGWIDFASSGGLNPGPLDQ